METTKKLVLITMHFCRNQYKLFYDFFSVFKSDEAFLAPSS